MARREVRAFFLQRPIWIWAAALVLPISTAVPGTAAPFGFVGNQGDDTLTVIDLSTGAPAGPDVDLLPEGDYPYDVTLNPSGTEVWVCGAVGDGVLVVDTTTHAIIERIDLTGTAEYPVDVVFDASGATAYVASRDSDVIAVINTGTYMVVDTIPIVSNFFGPGKLAFNAARNELYSVEWFDDLLYIIDAATGSVTPLSIGNDLWDLVVDPTGDVLYLADRGDDQILVFDLETRMVTSSIGVGDDPWGIDLSPDGSLLLVANEDSAEVSAIDTTTEVVTPIFLPGAEPRDVDITEDGLTAYVPSGNIGGTDAVYAVDLGTLTVSDTVLVGEVNPNCIAVARDSDALLFADGFESGDLSGWTGV